MTIIARRRIKSLGKFELSLGRETMLILKHNNMGSVKRGADEVEISIVKLF